MTTPELTGREGVAPTDYIEAALHALHANRPDVAHRYLVEAFGSRAYGELLRGAPEGYTFHDPADFHAVQAAMVNNMRLVIAAHQAGESND